MGIILDLPEWQVLFRDIETPGKQEVLDLLSRMMPCSQDFVVIVTGAFQPALTQDEIEKILAESIRILKSDGLLFVQGYPEVLPGIGVYLDRFMKFRYWIAVESEMRIHSSGYPSVHSGLLLFSKNFNGLDVSPARFPHHDCSACGRSLRDWGGKSHLRNPAGVAISDVWKEYPLQNHYTQIQSGVFNTITQLTTGREDRKGIVLPREALEEKYHQISEPEYQMYLPFSKSKVVNKKNTVSGGELWNVVHSGDALEILKQYSDNSVDLVFADPPYNLDKAYSFYEDERSAREYIEWCNAWLQEYVRILKPSGSLYVLNLPHWGIYHADFLNRYLYFQNWIVWDALSEPRGKLMPAHYSLLFYTKHRTQFTFNREIIKGIDSRKYCLRASCVNQRKRQGKDEKEPVTDIWWDIHRLRHRRDRDYHPCQLPDALLERIIQVSSNPGDVVLDALAGTGTTAVVAAKLGRRYVAIDLDEAYVEIARQKLADIETFGQVVRRSISKPKQKYSKRALQIELSEITKKLGRLPTLAEIAQYSQYGIEAFKETFPNWGKALKAAKLEIGNDHPAA